MDTKPVLMCIDDDPSVLSAISRDLRRHYGEYYRVVRADSGSTALESLEELKRRSEPVALFLVDQRMPRMSGVEFLAQAIRLFPEAKRAMLTAYADTDAAIQAINSASVHHYLLKPWDPPEEALYPVLDDLLEDWQANYRPAFSGIHIIGHRWSSPTHQLKDFLARNQIPYHYLDMENDPTAAEKLAEAGQSPDVLPVVILVDGEVMTQPSTHELAEHMGLKMQAGRQFYDLAIVGGGPAGLAAAVYGASEGLSTVLIEREATGGQAGTSSRIENYLGFPSGLSGGDLARRATAQARRFGVEILSPLEVSGLRLDGPYRILQLSNGEEIACHALVVAVGLSYHKLNLPGADRLAGAGVFYGASLSEALSCKDQRVFVVGAGNSAGQAAMYLAQHASEVVICVRSDSLASRMSQYLVERIENTPNIKVRLHTEVIELYGEDHLEAVSLCDVRTRQGERLEASALFIFIGAAPQTDWLADIIERDERGYILTGPQIMREGRPPPSWTEARDPFLLEASVPGIFVVGDVRANSVKRVASAVGEGSIAVQFIHQHLAHLK